MYRKPVLNEDDETDEDEDDVKKKQKNTNFGKIATAIGQFKSRGIQIAPPNINTSYYTFIPDREQNKIIYGLKGITRISNALIEEIMAKRPYSSSNDFFNKVKTNKLQATNLIKSGAFDELDNLPRETILYNYLIKDADIKTKITLQNMNMLIEKDCIPDDKVIYGKVFMFNKMLKKNLHNGKYTLPDGAENFIINNFDPDLILDDNKMDQKKWDKAYNSFMAVFKNYLKDNQQDILDKVNNEAIKEVKDKYAFGNISSWEMESISFYYHQHELNYSNRRYSDFSLMSTEPQIINSFIDKQTGRTINVYDTCYIAGTVLDKDKNKNTVSLLTQTGVVNLKVWKNQFAMYDRTISKVDFDGKKHKIEESWFKKGTLLMVQGYRRGDDFVLKKPKSSPYPVISKIEIKNGNTYYTTERADAN